MGKRISIQCAYAPSKRTLRESTRPSLNFNALHSRLDGDLERTAAVHLVERGLVVLKLEDIRDLRKKVQMSDGLQLILSKSDIPCPSR